jgi:hypothetical protein
MSVYTVHEPPLRAGNLADPERFAFVRDGFYFWAFLLAPLWMLRHRMWLMLLLYVVIVAGVEIAMRYAGAGAGAIALIELLIALLIGLEGGSLRRLALTRRGWKEVGVVVGASIEEAEHRFFEAWTSEISNSRRNPAVPPAPHSASPPPRTPPDVVGLFPEPGANR